ncbi:GNAT family N-acetyltransferase [Clostridium sp. MCC353]|uniref:GNAT family N-acetyltransferase n=1 Tax=Clostridium sp. MCC353 TaxID=2592646 RepID=UPI001C025867|nr:GNAT family N-acetyltransferase [Clostridium sp. MCC353]MBT9775200.1 GNAT family N-acetyltransferase [Clostridium sp. MCC353]
MSLTFEKISTFDKGILHRQLVEGYSFDNRWRALFEKDWIEYDDFFFDNLSIADKCGFVTVLDGLPIGHISWDPRNAPGYTAVGHNCIIPEYKGMGYGKKQLQEAVGRIRQYDGLKKIIVTTNSALTAPYNYESVGFKLCQRRKNQTESSFSGDFLDYEMIL